MFRFVSKQRKTLNAVEMSSLIFWLQAKELRLSACSNALRNLNGSLNKRRTYPTQTITTEWTAAKCLDKRVQSKQTHGHKLGKQTNRWSKVQADARCPDSKKQLKQQATPKTTSIKNRHSIQSTNLARIWIRSFSLSMLSEISQTEYVRHLTTFSQICRM